MTQRLKISCHQTASSAWYLSCWNHQFLQHTSLSASSRLSFHCLSDYMSYLPDILDDDDLILQHHCLPHLLFTNEVTPLTAHIYLIPLLQSYLSCDLSQLCFINLIKSSAALLADSSSAASSTASQTLLHLLDCCVLAVYQLKQFEFMNHQYVLLISNDVVSLAHSIIILYSISVRYKSSADILSSQQTHDDFTQSTNLDYSMFWSLTRSSLTSVIQQFVQKTSLVQNHSAFVKWTVSQTSSYKETSNSFEADHRLQWSIASVSDQLYSTASSFSRTDQSHKLSLFKICCCTSILAETILCELSLHCDMANNNEENDSHHSNTLNLVFFEAQMQMLHSMIAQTKEDDWAEDCAENHSGKDLSWWSESYQYEDHSH